MRTCSEHEFDSSRSNKSMFVKHSEKKNIGNTQLYQQGLFQGVVSVFEKSNDFEQM